MDDAHSRHNLICMMAKRCLSPQALLVCPEPSEPEYTRIAYDNLYFTVSDVRLVIGRDIRRHVCAIHVVVFDI